MTEIKTYNEKAFLLPTGIHSCACYHAKILPDGEYAFRIHDCIAGVRIRGTVTDKKEAQDAVVKLRTLARAAKRMADFIKQNYVHETDGMGNIPERESGRG